MELKIYDKQGIVKMTVSPDNSSQWNHEVGVENVVTVNFTTWEFLVLEVGWYILVEGQRFSIKFEYRPKHIHDTKYTYNLKFYGREHDAQDILFCRLNQGEEDMESVFAYDGTPMDFLQKVVANMNRNTDGVVWKAGEAISANRQTINFNGLYCWDALAEIARSFGVEWWIDGTIINLNKCIRGESISLGYGEGLKSGLTQKENTNAIKWFTRLIPIGSTRNIDRNKYGYANLQLPDRKKYIDINNRYGLKEYREEAAFSDIYPHRVGTISSVRSDVRINEDTGDYTVYYVKDSDLPFNPDEYMLGGEVIHMTFNTGALAGKEFEVNWNVTTQEFEIINQYPDETSQLPGGNLIPSVGDSYVLSNISMPDEYNTIAEDAFQKAVEDYLDEYDMDISIYTGDTDYIYVEKNNIPLMLGQRVSLVSEQYFETGYRDSRITRVSRKLNNLGEASIDCSNSVSSSWIQKLGSNINNVTVNQRSDQKKISKNEKDVEDLSGLWELRKNDQGDKYLYTPYNVLTALGFTSYSTGRGMRFPSIYDGLPIDYQTLYWEEIKEEVGTDEGGNPIYKTTKVLKAKGGTGGGGESPNLEAYATRDWVSTTFTPQAAHNSIARTVGILQSDFTAMVAALGNKLEASDFNNWKSTNEPKIANGLTAYNWGNHADAGYVGIANEQTITGKKNFTTGGLFVNGQKIEYIQIDNSKGYWKLEGDLIVSGGITSFASSSGYKPSTIMDAIVCDEQTITIEEVNGVKRLKVIGGSGGSTTASLTIEYEGAGNAITALDYKNGVLTATKGQTFAAKSGLDAINTRVTTLENTINSGDSSNSSFDIEESGSGNAYTSYTYADGKLTLKKETSFATASQLSTLSGTVANKADKSSVYTKTEVDTKVNAKANTSDVYTKSEVDTKVNVKANISDVYTKTEVDTKVNAKWTTDNSKISQWNAAYGWGNHADAGYVKSSSLTETLKSYVTVGGNATQTITGKKNFTGGLLVNGQELFFDKTERYWKMEGNLLVTGGITSYSSDGKATPFLIDVTEFDEITSTSTTQVYTANAVSLIQKQLKTTDGNTTNALDRLKNLQTALKGLSASSVSDLVKKLNALSF